MGIVLGYLYLALSTALITVWALCYKFAVRYKCDLLGVNFWLYVGSTIVVAAYFYTTGCKWSNAAAILGVVSGVACFVSTVAFFYHIRTGVLAVSWTVIGLALGFPVLASIFVWHENPSLKQIIGLVLIPIAFVLCNPGKEKETSK